MDKHFSNGSNDQTKTAVEAIAIIGIGCRFPGAENPESFWKLLRYGVDAIKEIPASRWDVNDFYDPTPATPGKMNTRWGGFLEQVDQFDAQFFRISSREAQSMDPQQRLLLEVSWEALENAGQSPEKLARSQTGVFIGISNFDYSWLLFSQIASLDAYACTGNALSVAANRLSYFLDLQGPSLAVDTACSSSLVAVHQACLSLHQRECQLAIVGGVNLILTPQKTIVFSQARMMAADSRCKAFDASADGYVRGEGCGVIVLKRLCDAKRDGDNIQAIIRGSAVNQDGCSNGLTAPKGPSQQAVIRQALENAKVQPAQISYVEAHGTGTSLGDPIEVNSLKTVLMKDRPPEQPCWIGSVKTNIGHLEAAAGIAGLIKVVLSLQHREIPPHLHLNQLNSHISLEKTTISIPTECQSWSCSGSRLAGVSSFGFGGTNCHVVLEEAPRESQHKYAMERPKHILTLSANENALLELAQRYENFLASHPEALLADICFTANTGRSHFDHRLAVVTESTMQLRQQLSAFANSSGDNAGLVSRQVTKQKTPKIVFLFTGQGSQYVNMGRQLYETQPTFRASIERCDEILRSQLQTSLLEILYPANSVSTLLNETAYTQPALFALEYALVELWKSWGIEPAAVMGHSLGEYVAACVAGVFSLEDGLKLIAERAYLMQALPQNGEMVAILADEGKVKAAIQPYAQKVVIAAINNPQNIVISGVSSLVRAVCATLEAEGIKTTKLKVSHAFHSPLMEQMLDAFEQKASLIPFQALRIPLISNLTGEMMLPGQILDANYWRRHTRETVRFMAGLNTLFKKDYELFLEVGSKPILSSLGKSYRQQEKALWLPSLAQGRDDWQILLESLSTLYVQGVNINWHGFDQDYSRSRLSLPTYPFQRKRYWIKQENLAMNENKLDVKVSKFQAESLSKTKQRNTIISTLRSLVANWLQTDVSKVKVDTSFFEMGIDSIFCMIAVQNIENTFQVKVNISQFFEELTTIDALATYIEQNISSELSIKGSPQSELELNVPSERLESEFTRLSEQSAPAAVLKPPIVIGTDEIVNRQNERLMPEASLEGIIEQQIQFMSQVLELLGKERLQTKQFLSKETAPTNSTSEETSAQSLPHKNTSINMSLPSAMTATASSSNVLNNTNSNQLDAKHSLFAEPTEPEQRDSLTFLQQQYLDKFVARYTKRTQGSKRQKQVYHPVLTDKRSALGFRPSIKEMIYPIVGKKSKGSRIWDVDGNEYIDISMGFGVHLFGHGASFITEALEEQIKEGIQIGPQSNLAGQVADLISELTGMERVTFCSTGTEAVMTAIRLARAVTGRTKIALFASSYHGQWEGTLVRPSLTVDGKLYATPTSLGVPPQMVEDTLVLNYGDFRALNIIKAHEQELAAVLVEPVQTSRPDLQPKAFLQELRQLTKATGIPLIFDEIVTGFRIHPGGAQALFGVEADIATYGKALGGGMPIGVLAGKAAYMDAIDGGLWNYGDETYPQTETIYFAGTFNKNPLTLATTRAVLQYLKKQGPALQQQLNQRTSQLAEILNNYFKQENVPIKISYFGSLFRFGFSGNFSNIYSTLETDLFFYHLLEKGIYVWEGRRFFLSTAHTNEDIDYLIHAVKKSVEEMRVRGFLLSKNSQESNSNSNFPSSQPANPTTLVISEPIQKNSSFTDTVTHGSPVCSYNEWDPLEEVIVGMVDGAMIPSWHTIYRAAVPPGQDKQLDNLSKQAQMRLPYPDWLVQNTNKCLEEFVHILESEGIVVRRPDVVDYSASFRTPAWEIQNGFCSANPRDVFLVIGNEIIEAPMPDRGRYFETWAYRSLLKEYLKAGAKWTAAPKPQLLDELYDLDYKAPRSGEEMRFVITEFEPTFDAADFVRFGRDIFVQKSHVTNSLGIEWLQRHLGDAYQVHVIESRCPQAMHIDTTLVPLAPGKVLVNPINLDVNNLPDYFKSWDILIAPQPDRTPMTLYGTNVISRWVNMNVLSLDEERVIVEKSQESMIKALKDWGFKPIPCNFESYYPFLGSFHCATLDVRRRGILQSYS